MKENKSARPGSIVEILIPSGKGISNGRIVQEWRPVRGRVVFVFDTHLVVNIGGRYGTPKCAETYRLIKH